MPEGMLERMGVLVQLKGKGSFYIAQYPVRWTAQSASHFVCARAWIGTLCFTAVV